MVEFPLSGFPAWPWQGIRTGEEEQALHQGAVAVVQDDLAGGQAGLAYWLVARGLRGVSPQEAGTLTLLEPLLNPAWAYLVSPRTETPSACTVAGGAFILGALAWRYWPYRTEAARGRGF
jgi:hypothetical protein